MPHAELLVFAFLWTAVCPVVQGSIIHLACGSFALYKL